MMHSVRDSNQHKATNSYTQLGDTRNQRSSGEPGINLANVSYSESSGELLQGEGTGSVLET